MALLKTTCTAVGGYTRRAVGGSSTRRWLNEIGSGAGGKRLGREAGLGIAVISRLRHVDGVKRIRVNGNKVAVGSLVAIEHGATAGSANCVLERNAPIDAASIVRSTDLYPRVGSDSRDPEAAHLQHDWTVVTVLLPA